MIQLTGDIKIRTSYDMEEEELEDIIENEHNDIENLEELVELAQEDFREFFQDSLDEDEVETLDVSISAER